MKARLESTPVESRDPAAREMRALFEEVEKIVYAEKKSGCFPAQAVASA